jgi:hypothetical protein
MLMEVAAELDSTPKVLLTMAAQRVHATLSALHKPNLAAACNLWLCLYHHMQTPQV